MAYLFHGLSMGGPSGPNDRPQKAMHCPTDTLDRHALICHTLYHDKAWRCRRPRKSSFDGARKRRDERGVESLRCSVEAVHGAVSRKRALKETTIRTLLRRLELKGYLEHESDGRAYIYRAAEPARSLAARAVRQIIDRLCQGSVEQLVCGMVEAKVLNKHEMDRIEEVLQEARQGAVTTARTASK